MLPHDRKSIMIDMATPRIPPARFNTEIYSVLERHLRAAGDTPQTCVDLLEHSDIRAITDDTNRISNYLGHMWRKGLLQRHIAPPSNLSMARFAYTWKTEVADNVVSVEGIKAFMLEGPAGNVSVKRIGNTVTLESEHFRLTLQLK
jgi:hypothetical protein